MLDCQAEGEILWKRRRLDATLTYSKEETSQQLWLRLVCCVKETKPTQKKHEITCAPKLDPAAGSLTVSSGKAGDSNEAEEFPPCGGIAVRTLRNNFYRRLNNYAV